MKLKIKLHRAELSALRRRFMHQWIKRYKLLFIVLFVLVSGWGGIQWYLNLNRYAWTVEEKKAFLDRTIKETTFKEDQYRNVLEALDDLAIDHSTPLQVSRDIFAGKKEKKP